MVVYRHVHLRLAIPPPPIRLLLDIGQGVGLAGASGVRPFLPPLLAGALARGNLGVDFEGSPFAFLESPWFLLGVLMLAVVAYALEGRRTGEGPGASRSALEVGLLACGLILGALLFAGSLGEGGFVTWPGLIGGAATAALAFAAVSGLLGRARRRLDSAAAALLPVYADGLALVLAVVAVVLPPLSFLAIVAFVLVLVRGARAGGQKFEGLRILR